MTCHATSSLFPKLNDHKDRDTQEQDTKQDGTELTPQPEATIENTRIKQYQNKRRLTHFNRIPILTPRTSIIQN